MAFRSEPKDPEQVKVELMVNPELQTMCWVLGKAKSTNKKKLIAEIKSLGNCIKI